MILRVKYDGVEFYLLGDMETGGPICTRDQYRHFEDSYAYLRRDGKIMRYGEVVGTRYEIEVLGEAHDFDELDVYLRSILDRISSFANMGDDE